MNYVCQYANDSQRIWELLDLDMVERMAEILQNVRDVDNGRLFFLGVGGGAGHASHAASDFRNIAGMEAYALADNVSEITALTNDYGWESVFARSLKNSRLRATDAVMVFSVGGGDLEMNISVNLVRGLQYAKSVGARILGVVGRGGGYTARVADACVIIPIVNQDYVTLHTEGMQAEIWHLLVGHPRLKVNQTKWESVIGGSTT